MWVSLAVAGATSATEEPVVGAEGYFRAQTVSRLDNIGRHHDRECCGFRLDPPSSAPQARQAPNRHSCDASKFDSRPHRLFPLFRPKTPCMQADVEVQVMTACSATALLLCHKMHVDHYSLHLGIESLALRTNRTTPLVVQPRLWGTPNKLVLI